MRHDLSIEKINSVFDTIEQEIAVSSWEMDGLKIWPLIRNNHWLYLVVQKVFNSNNQIAINNNLSHQLKKIVSAGVSFARAKQVDKDKNDRIRKTDLLIAVATSTRFFKVDGAWYTPYSDSLIKHFREEDIDSLVLEFASDGRCLLPRFAPSIFVQNQSYYLSIQAKLRGKLNFPALKEQLEGWDDCLAIIDRELGADCRPNLNTVRTKARQILLHEQWFNKILQKTKPKVAIVGFSYCSADAMGLIRACRKLGILTIEIQHGVQGSEHMAYHRWAGLPEQGYDTLPDIFWTWSEEEKKYIDSWANSRPEAHRAMVGGNPCLHIYDQKGSYNPSSIQTLLNKTKEQALNVLFTAQAFDRLPDFFIEAIRQTPNWKWWIRIHPQYWEMEEPLRKQLEANNLANAAISTSSELPLIRLLEQCDVHVTEFSSSVLEAQSCGVASVIINHTAINLFKDLIAAEDVVYADSTELVISAIQLQEKKKIHDVKSEDGSCFFPDIMKEIKKRIHADVETATTKGI